MIEQILELKSFIMDLEKLGLAFTEARWNEVREHKKNIEIPIYCNEKHLSK